MVNSMHTDVMPHAPYFLEYPRRMEEKSMRKHTDYGDYESFDLIPAKLRLPDFTLVKNDGYFSDR